MLFANLIKTEGTKRIVRASVELPTITFSRMCYGYLHNDWLTVISSCVTLLVTITTFILSSGQHGRF
jgi:hypothetical protein